MKTELITRRNPTENETIRKLASHIGAGDVLTVIARRLTGSPKFLASGSEDSSSELTKPAASRHKPC